MKLVLHNIGASLALIGLFGSLFGVLPDEFAIPAILIGMIMFTLSRGFDR